MIRGVEPWIRKWWDIANGRRFKLITKKYKKSLTPDEIRELELLQEVADSVISYVGKKNPMKELRVFCADCKEPIEIDVPFPTHECPVHKTIARRKTV